MARYDASREKACTASLPQAPYDSATRGIHVHPNSEHLASLAECFLSSAATAADPAVRPASEIKVGLSGDTTVRSKAAGLPQSQLDNLFGKFYTKKASNGIRKCTYKLPKLFIRE